MNPRDMVNRFLESIGRDADAQYYLSLFQKEQDTFATVWVEPVVAENAVGALVLDLRFLAALGLSPAFVFATENQASAVAERLEQPDVVTANVDEAQAIAKSGRIPLLGLARSTLPEFVAGLGSRKVVLLGARSGLVRKDGSVPSLVDVRTECDALLCPGELAKEQATLVAMARDVLASSNATTHVTLTSPLDLLRELFTVRGAGTLIRRGACVVRRGSYDTADPERLTALFESAFGRRPVKGFFDRPIQELLVADDFRGAAILTQSPLGPYLSKFAVDVRAQGEGVGRDLWRAMADRPTLLWRARRQNRINAWYEAQCDGRVRGETWDVFWRGLPPERLGAAIEFARQQPEDF